MSANRDKDRSVIIYSSSDLYLVEAIAQELRNANINCNIDGKNTAGAFLGLHALDGIAMMNVVVLESDASAAREIAEQWLNDTSSEDPDDGA